MPRTEYDQGIAHIKQGLALLKVSEPLPAPQNRKPSAHEWTATVARMRELRESGKPFLDIADELHAAGHRGRWGGRIYAATVRQTLLPKQAKAKAKPIEQAPDPVGDILRRCYFEIPGAKTDFRHFIGALVLHGYSLPRKKIKARLNELGVMMGVSTGNRLYLGNIAFDRHAEPGKPYRLVGKKLRQS